MLFEEIPEPYLVRLGRLTVEFAAIESQMSLILTALLSPKTEEQAVGQIVASNLSFANMRAVILSLHRHHHGDSDDSKELKGLMMRAGTIEVERNQITHSVWQVHSDTKRVTRVKATAREKHGLVVKADHYDLGRFDKLLSEMDALQADLFAFYLTLNVI